MKKKHCKDGKYLWLIKNKGDKLQSPRIQKIGFGCCLFLAFATGQISRFHNLVQYKMYCLIFQG